MSRVRVQNVCDQILERIEQLVAEIDRRSQDGSLSIQRTRLGIIERLRSSLLNLRRIEPTHTSVDLINVVTGLASLLAMVRSDVTEANSSQSYSPTIVYTGLRGRPCLSISDDQLEYLLITLNLSVPRVAQCLGVSVRTIHRRMSQNGQSRRSRYSSISDGDLDHLIGYFIRYRMMLAHLRSHGIIVQERRVRNAMIRINPVGVSSRWSRHRAIHRRIYSVAHPNAVWHIDGNHSLCRWGFYVHGGVDGYSRAITYLNCSLTNSAQSVAKVFVSACCTFGIPSRVRSDHGGENILVAEIMLLIRGLNRGSHITGRSIHNQRIERMWRDVFNSCLSLYYQIFYYLEDAGVLDPDNHLHRLAV